ncbi:tetratricopeptide repeat protein [Flavobacterium sp. DG1-102-2]|uniref:tetratricopeptide repeat protein n=1 Tax=Flavobacterium sp. DG1-102-2 TaxID=3081663 RepID=UPI002948C7F3|nr:tetratricopeptide repeat protein [Flavobacterium sp. DG1-102-2]MDV6168834.1 tetratricopeptide repeat protein [Flavobacterium sp. DG1-102-2]
MNTKDFTYLLNKPYSLNEKQTAELENILSEFPFLQSARAVYLKGLYNQDSFRYNTELKKTAAYTTDRALLFDFITSEQFQTIEKEVFAQQEIALQSIDVNDSEVIAESQAEEIKEIPVEEPVNKLEESLKRSIQVVEDTEAIRTATENALSERLAESIKNSIKATQDTEQAGTEPIVVEKPQPEPDTPAIEATEEKLSIGKPLEFNSSETHSFAEWLQLSKLTPINRDEEKKKEPEITENEVEKEDILSKKMEIIDRFIEANPKIAPVRNNTPSPANIEKSTQDNSMLMTETLARVYLEQKKYSKAIQAYEILILKYPEKSVFFADRISDIKIIQQNNNLKNDA